MAACKIVRHAPGTAFNPFRSAVMGHFPQGLFLAELEQGFRMQTPADGRQGVVELALSDRDDREICAIRQRHDP